MQDSGWVMSRLHAVTSPGPTNLLINKFALKSLQAVQAECSMFLYDDYQTKRRLYEVYLVAY